MWGEHEPEWAMGFPSPSSSLVRTYLRLARQVVHVLRGLLAARRGAAAAAWCEHCPLCDIACMIQGEGVADRLDATSAHSKPAATHARPCSRFLKQPSQAGSKRARGPRCLLGGPCVGLGGGKRRVSLSLSRFSEPGCLHALKAASCIHQQARQCIWMSCE